MSTKPTILTVGQSVTWLYVPRGGWGYTYPVPATITKIAAKRVQIEAPLRRGGTKLVWVTPEKLKARD